MEKSGATNDGLVRKLNGQHDSLREVKREDYIARLKSEAFDLLIIGGGITGAGIALDAASRGLKTALVEKNDFAFGTSSRSTKLIHGGLRYLKQLEFGLVKEVGSERAVVHKLAPHLVVPEKMLLPLYEKRGFGSVLTSIGLKLYDFLAGVKPEDQRRMLTRSQTLKQEPLLDPRDVKGGAIYAEYRTDDARLTIEIIKTAAHHGAVVANYCEALDFIYEQGSVKSVRVKDHISRESFDIRAHVVVSAAGPWVDELRHINHSRHGKRLHLTKGVHLVVPHEKLPVRQAIYFDVEDGRMIFAIPRGRTTYIGTTDTNYTGSLEEVYTSKADALYLIQAVNRTFPKAALTLEDVESSWAGLRPLIHEEGKSASELSRKDEIFESETGLISIAGGKLTGYRKMAERIVDRVMKKYFPEKFTQCKTQFISFTGSGFKNDQEVSAFVAAIAFALRSYGLEEEARYLVGNYGTQTNEILRNLEQMNSTDNRLNLLQAELKFCIDQEMVIRPADFLIRRTGLLYFNKPLVDHYALPLLQIFKKLNNWTDQTFEQEKAALENLIAQTTSFKLPES
jgi:glycerol-3-phosphate dehydrogenase